MNTLFDPIKIGDITLANRIVMAPLTRNRAIEGNKPGPLTVEYYRQRASAGLIVAEASPISPTAQGYLDTPGIWSAEQVEAWKAVTGAVHAEGGKIVLQIWHVGRISHTSLLPAGEVPVSSTDKAADASTFTRDGFIPVSKPRALRDDEIPALIDDYRRAARNAIGAGFDGVEIHAANTYLIEQFLRDSVNERSGPYGGSVENRARLLLEVTNAVIAEIGAGRTGIRLSPMTTFTAPRDSNPQATYGYVVDQLAPLGLAYLHMIEGETGGTREPEGAPAFDYAALRSRFPGAWMVNNGYTKELGKQAVSDRLADLVAYGRPFISNPDLVRRLRDGAPLNELRADKLYGGGAEGYTDYPALAA
ncbi:alkene reductase [Dechloromonas sp. XY25]|uniref:Alkene reductase n=1 Tax=Dechloromonas hankyongensis TaxID=2908002 RepID=A0ABS9K768_9RHOO|nr:alkene reductase [Dechloromonas hankyongensis]MCG2579012.1 alkene reductase [Dechloromonas hankyongensis]